MDFKYCYMKLIPTDIFFQSKAGAKLKYADDTTVMVQIMREQDDARTTICC